MPIPGTAKGDRGKAGFVELTAENLQLGDVAHREALPAKIVDLQVDCQCGTEHFVGLSQPSLQTVERAEVGEYDPFGTSVSDIAVHGQRILIGGHGLVHAPLHLQENRQVSGRDALVEPIFDLAEDLDGGAVVDASSVDFPLLSKQVAQI